MTFVYRENRAFLRRRRIANALVAALVICVAVPVLVVAILAILLEDGFPVIFRQQRVGRFERPFTMYKLRTMKKEHCGDRVSPMTIADSRITRVGRWLRRTSIDELPQLVNVIRGEMSLVGPRPEMPFIVSRYENWQHLRHLVEPGLTGLWQVTHRSKVPLARPEATMLDLEYVRTASPKTDGILLARTVKAVLFADGAF
jgi:lipopolysaccharide/colanic/teichoic acid biosynthesis glycosyltransferase